jgi:hypothetical protein
MKNRLYFLFIGLVFSSCSQESCPTAIKLADGKISFNHSLSNDSIFEENYYINGVQHSQGLIRYGKRIGLWKEFYMDGKIRWEGYYDFGVRIYPLSFGIDMNHTSVKFRSGEPDSLKMGENYYFNFVNTNLHPDDIVFDELTNCKIERVNPSQSGGYDFKLVTGNSKDSLGFVSYCNIFQHWNLYKFVFDVY